MNTGEHLWMRPVGKGPVDHPALHDAEGVPDELGWMQRVFLLTTPTLLFATPGSPNTGGSGYFIDQDASLHAYDKETGEQLGHTVLPHNTEGGLIS